jgi:hypothetical protein
MRETCTSGSCVQRRLACSAGGSLAKIRARSLVAWMAGRRETKDLKPIDRAICGMAASHRAVTRVNAQVAPKMEEPGGRVRDPEDEGSMQRRNLAEAAMHFGGVRATAR